MIFDEENPPPHLFSRAAPLIKLFRIVLLNWIQLASSWTLNVNAGCVLAPQEFRNSRYCYARSIVPQGTDVKRLLKKIKLGLENCWGGKS